MLWHWNREAGEKSTTFLKCLVWGKVVSVIGSFAANCQGQWFHRRQSTNERERAWKAGFHAVQLLQFRIVLYSERGDHHDDTEFIPRNASVIAVMEHISFTVSERINSGADSVVAHLISHTWLFTWASTDREWRLIKRLSTTYSYGMYI